MAMSCDIALEPVECYHTTVVSEKMFAMTKYDAKHKTTH